MLLRFRVDGKPRNGVLYVINDLKYVHRNEQWNYCQRFFPGKLKRLNSTLTGYVLLRFANFPRTLFNVNVKRIHFKRCW